MSLFRRIFGSSRQAVVLGKADDDPDEPKPAEEEPEPPADRPEPTDEEGSDGQ